MNFLSLARISTDISEWFFPPVSLAKPKLNITSFSLSTVYLEYLYVSPYSTPMTSAVYTASLTSVKGINFFRPIFQNDILKVQNFIRRGRFCIPRQGSACDDRSA